ncbi:MULTISPECIES: hypothetical protein [Bradyrhizobium]|jgi:hypothetical protein|uniref:hypothetical protein n=1 Tax=Bradyrhizobium TaxID=374 RepID=UPI000A889716|nr:hypothetical protein [Bradyrhizobium japonicum]MCP1808402.1 hypothetical protein [Bradyrhizobium japonicum]MCP1817329.1 hypothetical protein [Bradyrhizobium japonicum]MCP1871159.1 hypothetical protein [Bradyrhizobium japonicum]MCP1939134.1 hypothetical protein [Bradyrhizobium japonicum]MCP1952329.1 hypothetical protein [Bradyrhizobium japonicum]
MQKPRLAGAFGICNVFRPGAMRAAALSRLDEDLSCRRSNLESEAGENLLSASLVWRSICGGPRDLGDDESKARRCRRAFVISS